LADREADPEDRAAGRAGYAQSVAALGLVWIQQLRFKDAIAMAGTALDVIGPPDDLATGWLRYLRAWGTICWAPRPEALPDLEAAVGLARAGGDRRLELE